MSFASFVRPLPPSQLVEKLCSTSLVLLVESENNSRKSVPALRISFCESWTRTGKLPLVDCVWVTPPSVNFSVTFRPTVTVAGVPPEIELGIFQVSVGPDGVSVPGPVHS